MNSLKIAFLLMFFFLTIPQVYSQSYISISFHGGYSLPLPDLKGNVNEEIERSSTYLTKSGFNTGLSGSMTLNKKKSLRLILTAEGNFFTGSASYTLNNLSYDVKNKINIFSLSTGIENLFVPQKKFSPYIGLDFTGNLFTGSFQQTSSDVQNDSNLYNLQIEPTIRLGLAIGLGGKLKLSKRTNLFLGIKYSFANLIGKNYTTEPSEGKTGLNDKANPNVSISDVFDSNRNITYIQFNFGFSYDFSK